MNITPTYIEYGEHGNLVGVVTAATPAPTSIPSIQTYWENAMFCENTKYGEVQIRHRTIDDKYYIAVKLTYSKECPAEEAFHAFVASLEEAFLTPYNGLVAALKLNTPTTSETEWASEGLYVVEITVIVGYPSLLSALLGHVERNKVPF